MIRRGLVMILGSLMIAGCTVEAFTPDLTPPSMPRGVFTSAGDNVIDVYWDPVPDYDVAAVLGVRERRYNGRLRVHRQHERDVFPRLRTPPTD